MWSIILHGGAKTIAENDAPANRSGCRRALVAGVEILRNGGNSVDAVEAAVRVLEDDPTFNAGYGSARNSDGEVEMCAALMEGAGFHVGAVAVAKGLRNPISVAKAMLYEEPVLIASDGARAFATEAGELLCDPDAMIAVPKRSAHEERGHDTVGCLALDGSGRIAAAVSTGGLEGAPPGRVGDSPQPGCGFYCDDNIGGVVFSGDGEQIARMILAARVMQALEDLSPDQAVEAALAHLERTGGEAGGIVLTPDGKFGWAHSSEDFAVAFASSAHPDPQIYLRKGETRRG
ncbi:isoaspartyl peptidase/L-asparaginase family protein [Rhizobium mesoamericanum]|uniref:Asparaginase n=1 Tax=Rhizobium mesoamericanum STM3625 TaxID=1211777 RepID=K0Q5G4_9HYPH|nr:isoaspartyl peptidase/L-asparaginase family protein [Rhizobium mesoamericanum]CCM78494.1 Asparaginase [Rhizobium mesoamericanum STM3625]